VGVGEGWAVVRGLNTQREDHSFILGDTLQVTHNSQSQELVFSLWRYFVSYTQQSKSRTCILPTSHG
jgi:hypothetical protein